MTVCQLRRLLASTLAVLAVVVSLPAAADARPAPEEYAGINIQKLIFEMPPTSWFTHFNKMESAGIKLVRFDALWQRLEPAPPVDGRHTYRWDRFDPIVGELAKRGIRWLPIIGYAAKWAATSTAHYAAPPRSPAEYAEYAGAVAGRYGSNGSYWREHPEISPLPVTDYEIWNAPNNPAHYYPRPDARYYADMFLAAREAIRAADPGADVWVGGLAGVDAPAFVRAMYSARPQLRGRVDAVGIHPYGHDARHTFRLVVELRRTLDALSEETVGIPVTEIGWSTSGNGPGRRVTDSQRAGFLAVLTEGFGRSDCGVWTFMPHTWVTKEQNPFNSGEWFGLFRPDTTPHGSGTAYLQALRGVARRGRADVALCDRVARVAAEFRTRRVSRTVERRSSHTGRTTRVRRRMRRICHRAKVRIGSSPLEGATVRFEYAERRGRRRRKRVVTRTTLRDGTADVCRTLSARRRTGRPRLELRRVIARDDGLVHDAVVVRRLRPL